MLENQLDTRHVLFSHAMIYGSVEKARQRWQNKNVFRFLDTKQNAPYSYLSTYIVHPALQKWTPSPSEPKDLFATDLYHNICLDEETLPLNWLCDAHISLNLAALHGHFSRHVEKQHCNYICVYTTFYIYRSFLGWYTYFLHVYLFIFIVILLHADFHAYLKFYLILS